MAKITVRPLADIVEKWTRVTPGRTADYEAGVRNPLRDWASSTAAAEGRWGDAVTTAVAEKRFSKGVGAAGTGKWSRKTVELGIPRWGPGVRVAGPDFSKGWSSYHEELDGLDIPERYPAGDPRNIDRVAAIAKALHERKIKG